MALLLVDCLSVRFGSVAASQHYNSRAAGFGQKQTSIAGWFQPHIVKRVNSDLARIGMPWNAIDVKVRLFLGIRICLLKYGFHFGLKRRMQHETSEFIDNTHEIRRFSDFDIQQFIDEICAKRLPRFLIKEA